MNKIKINDEKIIFETFLHCTQVPYLVPVKKFLYKTTIK